MMMEPLLLAATSLRARISQAGLCVFAVAMGTALLCALSLLAAGLGEGLTRNARGIDMVVGAPGSKLQLILSAIYHSDVPNGNIDSRHLARLTADRQVRTAIPIVIGDSYRGLRVVGTTPAYLALYDAKLGPGRLFEREFEIVAGAMTGLSPGDRFAASHGLSPLGGDVHDDHLFTVVGVLGRTGTALDRLLLTSVESVRDLHAHHDHDHEHHDASHQGHDDDHDHAGHHEHAAGDDEPEAARQVTAILVQTRSPLGTLNLARQVNLKGAVMAAVPSYELARLSSSLGLGRDVLAAIGLAVVALSLAMLFSMLASGLAARRYELALLRVLGASRATLFATIMAEGAVIGFAGAVIGTLLGHGLAFALAASFPALETIIVPAGLLMPVPADLSLIAMGLLAGLLAAIPPALSASRLDIAGLLARGA